MRTTASFPRAFTGLVLCLAVPLVLGGCGSTTPYTLGPIKTEDPDDRPTERPPSTSHNMLWDRVDMSVFYQLEKPLDLNWTGRKLGQAIGVADSDEADNVNVLGEPPSSSWWHRRHFYDEMTPKELAVGPNERDMAGPAAGPDRSEPWTVVGGDLGGATSSFVIEDARDDRYIIKLDRPNWPELASSGEAIATKILYAAGYNVPQNTITYFTPEQLEIGDGVTTETGEGQERPLAREDLKVLLADQPRRDDGSIRALASKFVEGEILGPFEFRGTLGGDENDRVRHEDRRELRGLRVIGSWINDTDRRPGNTLAVYTEEEYVKHYLIDMNSTLGSHSGPPQPPIHGQAYLVDQRKIPQVLLSFGTYRFPWWNADGTPTYPSVGYFRAEDLNPGEWVPTYPNPAYEKLTERDGYWGAKLVMSFSDEDLRAIVETGDLSNPNAEEYLLEVLKKRRDKIGRYWFDRVNPLDRFSVVEAASARRSEQANAPARFILAFEDLAVEGGLEAAEDRSYEYRVRLDGESLGETQTADAPRVPLKTQDAPFGVLLNERGRTGSDERVVRIDLKTRQEGTLSPSTRVYVHVPASGSPRVVGIDRR